MTAIERYAKDRESGFADGHVPFRRPEALQAPSRSIVIPVYNGAATIISVVDDLLSAMDPGGLEVVLVNDGSQDDSERICRWLAQRHPDHVVFVQLHHNVGEQRAVLIGLGYARGRYIAIVDDDGQQGAEDVARMFRAAESGETDVVFGVYENRCHPWHRRLASHLYNRTAGWLFERPPGLYLSSFKVVSRFLADLLSRSDGPLVNIDAMIFQVTSRYAVLDVRQRPRLAGRSGYTYRKLFSLWLETCLGYSVLPFRTAMVAGLILAVLAFAAGALSAAGVAGPIGIGSAGLTVVLAAVLFYLGLLGECMVRFNRSCTAGRPAAVRYVVRKAGTHA